ncbi:hypothetical protein K7432_012013 [Basidiobolus ranarum]|uniref:Globin-sensor domain-containing protein n=1 Tax=Basidiobolus ranarum TaxID=34480 RepID=A0ABR2VSY7_9FUNG
MSTIEKSLYQTLGGEETISQVIDLFYSKYVLNDVRIKQFFVGVDMEKQRIILTKSLAFSLGGPANNGEKMNIAHRHLNLKDEHFDAVVDDLSKALRDLNVSEEMVAKVITVAKVACDDAAGRKEEKSAHKELTIEHVDRLLVHTDPVYRYQYVAKFVDFAEKDVEAIKSVSEQLAPLGAVLVDAVYDKLKTFDITWQTMAARHEGFAGKVVEDIRELDVNSSQIKYRKDMLTRYIGRLLNNPYDERMIKYLDWVAKIHTDIPGKKSKINVEYIHISALLGFVESTLIWAVTTLKLEREHELRVILAFNKVLWLQNDFFAKYYAKDGSDVPNSFGLHAHPTNSSKFNFDSAMMGGAVAVVIVLLMQKLLVLL